MALGLVGLFLQLACKILGFVVVPGGRGGGLLFCVRKVFFEVVRAVWGETVRGFEAGSLVHEGGCRVVTIFPLGSKIA